MIKLVKRLIQRLIEENNKEFKGKKLNCCDLNNKNAVPTYSKAHKK